MTDTATPVQPDQEEYSVIIRELQDAKTQLYSLRIVKAHEDAYLFADKRSVADVIYGGQTRIPRGAALRTKLEAAEVRVRIAEALLDSFNFRNDAYIDWETEHYVREVSDGDSGSADDVSA